MRLGIRVGIVLGLLVAAHVLAMSASAGSCVDITPYPVAAGESVVIQYDPAGRVLDGAATVYLHYGFDGWGTVPPDVTMTWNAADAAWEATVTVATTAAQLDVVFHDGNGTWDNNDGSDWHAFAVGGEQWKLDGQLDVAATRIAENNGYQLYAGLRGDILYVAATGARDGNDHFVFLAASPGALRAAPWSKHGNVAAWRAYLGNEVDSAWAGWFDATGTTQAATGTWLEGTINLAEEFGTAPSTLYLTLAPYESWDDGWLRPLLQVPASADGDYNLNANEYTVVDLASIRVGCSALDLNADCDVDADDVTLLMSCVQGPDVASCTAPDFDADADVDLADVAFFQSQFGSTISAEPLHAEDLGAGVTRFYPADVNPADLPASLALATTPTVYGTAPQPGAIEPEFFVASDRHVVYIPIAADIDLYGTGEVCGRLRRNGHTTTAWNTDAYGYGPGNLSLYQSHPWVLAVRPDGTAFGVFADTTYRCLMDLSTGILFAAEGPTFPLYLFEGDSPQEVVARLTDFIGRIEMPPLWALGYQQSRYSYYTDTYARWVANEFRNRDIPCDVIWFDIDYMDGYRIFTFNPTNFPDMSGLNNDLHNLGFHTVWMIDPGVKAESGYFVYDQGASGDHWIYDVYGNWYTGEVWPGDCHFPDFTRPDTRTWWAGLYANWMANGIDGVWNDMNEPGIFDGPGHSMPTDCWHRGGGNLTAGPHSQYHNVYGFLMSQASHAGMLAAKPDKRPFLLSRASYIGGQRYAAMWTGDNIADWAHLNQATPMVLNLGLSGQPFAGPDLGGFGGDAWGDLFARWMGVGVFMPFCRAHYDGSGVDQEPWAFGTTVEDECRTAIQRRYRLMPYLYTLFHEAATTGLPVARPVFFADPTDPSLRDEDVAFTLGADVLIVPNTTENAGAAPTPNLPGGIWRNVSLVGENSVADINQPDVRVRGGAIVPLGPVLEHTDATALNPLTLVVCLDASGFAEGWLYEDAGDGFDYLFGDYRHAHYTATQSGNVVTIAVADIAGGMATPTRAVNVSIVTASGVVTGTGIDADAGTIVTITLP